MNANELADKLLDSLTMEYDCDKYMEQAATMLRQQQAEIEALKMGFANSGTHDSELAETRAMAGRLFLKVQDLEFEQEGYENLTEMLESEKAELTEKNCQQQVLIENLNERIERMIEKQSHYESMAHAGGFEAGRELGMKQERERNNEPVAWRCKKFYKTQEGWFYNENGIGEPLYTHPVKELTDEEIYEIWKKAMQEEAKIEYSIYATQLERQPFVFFARAILRKAQEK